MLCEYNKDVSMYHVCGSLPTPWYQEVGRLASAETRDSSCAHFFIALPSPLSLWGGGVEGWRGFRGVRQAAKPLTPALSRGERELEARPSYAQKGLLNMH